MQNYEKELSEERAYFKQTIELIKAHLAKISENREQNRATLLSVRKEMWDDAPHASGDFDNVVELSQYLEEVNRKTDSYVAGINKIRKLEHLQESPYFARLDFTETGYGQKEKIYIGRHSLIDDNSNQVFICDWRSPIASIFYRFELGEVEYQTPQGNIHGSVSLKRQYEIKQGNFKYFFDANVQIIDEFLRKLLSKNASSKMTTIVESIQKDQDLIIRDVENDLLMVQGVAGSGKTSVALHRVAYLMYQGLTSTLSSNNIVILSPNKLFTKYIANVLPELGEDNVQTLAFEDICQQVLGKDLQITQGRNQFFEEIITCPVNEQKELLKSSMEFKASETFVTMLQRLISRYERKLIPFTNIYYNGKQLFDRHLLKSILLKRDTRIPLTIRLKHLETTILEKIRAEKQFRLPELEHFMTRYPEHNYELKEFARMLSIKENSKLLSSLRKFTEINYAALYSKIFQKKDLFYALAQGLDLPENIEKIRQYTAEILSLNKFKYEDILAITFLKIKMAGCAHYRSIKQVMVDEAQDYYPLHFEILADLFSEAKYTVLGDVNQTIEKQTSLGFYNVVQRILQKESSLLLTLAKSFRSTTEIIAFSTKFIDQSIKQECFNRNGSAPEIISSASQQDLDEQLQDFILRLLEENYKSLCILCKSQKESAELYERIKGTLDITLIDDTFAMDLTGVFITPIYMAKGLEFDVVLIYDVDDAHYQSQDDKKLLYIASTRALHRLALFYTGKPSRFLI